MRLRPARFQIFSASAQKITSRGPEPARLQPRHEIQNVQPVLFEDPFTKGDRCTGSDYLKMPACTPIFSGSFTTLTTLDCPRR